MSVFVLVGVCTVRLCVNDRDNEVCLEVKSESLLPELVINKKTSVTMFMYMQNTVQTGKSGVCVSFLYF